MITIKVQGGVHIEGGGRYILADPRSRPPKLPNVVLLSHAHRDHYSPSVIKFLRKIPIVMSRATRRLVDPHGKLANVVEVEPGGEVEVAGLNIRAYEAGHIIGSLQFSFELQSKAITYTGDFNSERRVILRPAEIVKSDILVIDATYGNPSFSFPERAELYGRLVRAVREEVESGGRVLIKGRRLGVAQEITALISLSLRTPPVVEERIARYNRFYEESGEFIGSYISSSSLGGNGGIAIAGLSSQARGFSKSIICTGWAVRRGIPLSSHVGYARILDYVLRSGASVVIPFVGYRKAFAEHLKSEYGIESSWADKLVIAT
ncbi:MAG: MBL fold metallo-hydrolase [Thermofilum sp.]